MYLSSFFDYPQNGAIERPEELIFLAEQSSGEWGKIFECTGTHRFKKNEIVINQGEIKRDFYIVTRGSLEVLMPKGLKTGDMERISLIEQGCVFGEQSFLDGKPRSANIRALTDGEMLTMNLETFEVLAAREPELARLILFDLARILSLRLRQTTSIMMTLAGKKL